MSLSKVHSTCPTSLLSALMVSALFLYIARPVGVSRRRCTTPAPLPSCGLRVDAMDGADGSGASFALDSESALPNVPGCANTVLPRQRSRV